MAIPIKAPAFPESVADGSIATWYKKPGDAVKRDELLVDIETDKVVMEVLAEADGVLGEIHKHEGDTVLSGEHLGSLNEGASAAPPPAATASAASAAQTGSGAGQAEALLSPAARKLVLEHGLSAETLQGSGKDGRITKEDVLAAIQSGAKSPPAAPEKAPAAAADAPLFAQGERVEKRVPMTRLRAKVAERLVEAQSSMAMLTTFNEVNMQPIMALRSKYKDLFEKKHDGVRLGFMSFFVKAAVEALKRQPGVNASIDGNDIVYHGYQDIGVAVSSDRGLVVPVLRNAEQMSLAEIEGGIANFGKKARDGKLSIEEMQGGTFTISNGGVFGSLLSTPIVNPPQTAILGMHKIQERPMAVNGQVVILPMMYLALSYDHRLIDGKEAVTFLVTIKDLLEDPARLLLDI
ncbi:dihydrolipoamide succinyltransferase [Ventosimonas gracilis]|uniref:Dihydrolipoyllysine-residue succinyltransferase component of 2-oxoglutarate dehydrogenase complex n=1 Tax=Ventosimonas gracilis TaxID=1680762 RepID=A0A139SVG7_9GAMM|nr:2-oxoglutarate dehydrogenase complex dihydrolipoyllysine-residue succinyltransferase [Ventosimonas gracilis]KXU38524.1 dihydrolipoamide succinyltransferase [Ventosimonas gracilis]